jgi:hypothetical protein
MKDQVIKQRFRTQIEATEGGNDQGPEICFFFLSESRREKREHGEMNRRRSLSDDDMGDTSPSRRRG